MVYQLQTRVKTKYYNNIMTRGMNNTIYCYYENTVPTINIIIIIII